MRQLVICIALLVFAGCGKQLVPTQEAAYKAEIQQYKMVKEHQTLQLDIIKINAEIARLKEEADKKLPVYNLTPGPVQK